MAFSQTEWRNSKLKNRVMRNGRWYALDREGMHGSHSTYSNYGCRCERCTNMVAESMRNYRKRLKDENTRTVGESLQKASE